MRTEAATRTRLRAKRLHSCIFFENTEQQTSALLPFVRDGIALGDRCILLIDGNQFGLWKSALEQDGIDVHASIEAGNLSFRSNSRWLPTGEFNSIRMARQVWEAIERSTERHPSVRVLADLSWTIAAGIPSDRVCHWEATLDCLLEGAPAQVVCMYNRFYMPVDGLHAALRTHHSVVLGERRFDNNPYYEAPAILAHEPDLNDCACEPGIIESMLTAFQQPV
jgi:hypothetical protein